MTTRTALILAFALGFGGAVQAQRPASLAAPAPQVRPVSPPAAGSLRRRISPGVAITLQPAALPFVVPLTLIGDMSGWTALTNGAVVGGPSVVRLRTGEGRIVVRANDGHLYVAPISLLDPGGPIDGSAWVQIDETVQSEPNCQPFMKPDSSSDMLCGYLGPNGSVRLSLINLSNGHGQAIDLGGQNAGFRPTVLPDPESGALILPPASLIRSRPAAEKAAADYLFQKYEVLTWDGAMASFRYRRKAVIKKPFEGQLTVYDADEQAFDPQWSSAWVKMASVYPSPFGCAHADPNRCAIGTLTDQVRVVGLAEPSAPADAPPLSFATKAAPNGLSLNIAPALVGLASGGLVVVARGKDGRIQSFANGAWTDQGGSARDGSGLSCLANNEQPICFIQGYDGRVYWRKFAISAGL